MIKLKFFGHFWGDIEWLRQRVESTWGDPKEYGFKLVTDDSQDFNVIINKPGATKISDFREKNIGVVMEPSWSSNYDINMSDYCFLTFAINPDMKGPGVKHQANLLFFKGPPHKPIWRSEYQNNKNFNKAKKLSIIVSNWNCKDPNRNYFWREKLVKDILNSDLEIDIFGKNWNLSDDRYKGAPICKTEALRDYEYSIALENSCEKYYVTEKFYDCILNNTVPIYYGCTKIHNYYDALSFETFDLKSNSAINDIKSIIKKDYKSREAAILRSKDLYFKNYNLFKHIRDNIS